MSFDFENLPLFRAVASRACPRCFDTGVWLTPENRIELCSRFQTELNPAAFLVRRAVFRVSEMKIYINPQAFDLARLLSNFSSESPCPRQEIFDTFYADTTSTYSNQLRKFHALVEELRNIWLLPVGSRKNEPSGYWIITELSDYKEWYNRAVSAPITQLSTIHKNARHNFPVFAEQMELEFFKDLKNGD